MTTFNPSDKSATIALTNGNLTATSSTGVSQSVRSTTSKSTGFVYWEVTAGAITNDIAVGIANATEPLNVSGGIGADANAAGFYCVSPAQALYCAGTPRTSGATPSVAGEVIKFAANFNTSPVTIWILTSKMVGWNNSGTANPNTLTGGLSITGIGAGPYFAIFNDDIGGAAVTINFGGSAFSGTVPTGFTAWDIAPVTGTIAATAKKPTASISSNSALPNETGTISASTKKPVASFVGRINELATIVASTKKPVATIAANSALPNETGTLSASTKKVVANVAGTSALPNETGTISASIKKSVANITSAVGERATITSTVRKVVGSFAANSALPNETGTITASVKKLVANAIGAVGEQATITSSTKKIVAGFAGTSALPNETGIISASTKKPIASFVTNVGERVSISASVKRPIGNISGTSALPNETGTLSASTKKLVAAFSGSIGEQATLTSTTKKVTATVLGSSAFPNETGVINSSAKKLVANFVSRIGEIGTIGSTTKKPLANATGTFTAPSNETGTITSTTKKLAVNISGSVGEIVSVSANMKKPIANFASMIGETGTISALVKKPTSNGSGLFISENSGNISSTIKKPIATFVGQPSPLAAMIQSTTKKLSAQVSGSVGSGLIITANVKKPIANVSGIVNSFAFIASNMKKPVADVSGRYTGIISLTPAIIYGTTDNYTYIDLNAHKPNNVYEVRGRETHVFPFTIAANKANKFVAYKLKRGTQDGSLRLWISKEPLDQQLFTTNDAFNPAYFLKNWARELIFWDQHAPSLPNGALILDPNTTYFINVKNAEAANNSYRLIFPV